MVTATCATVTIHDLSNGFLVLPLGAEVCVEAGNAGSQSRRRGWGKAEMILSF